MERLDKFLCDSGAGTRSQVKVLLKAGRVTVDGKVDKDNGKKIDPEKQVVALDGEVLGGKRRVVVMLNKPAGFVTATEDKTEKTVMELLPKEILAIFEENYINPRNVFDIPEYLLVSVGSTHYCAYTADLSTT